MKHKLQQPFILIILIFFYSNISAGKLLDGISNNNLSPAKLRILISKFKKVTPAQEFQQAFRLLVKQNLTVQAKILIDLHLASINHIDEFGETALIQSLKANIDNKYIDMIKMLASYNFIRVDLPSALNFTLLISEQKGGYSNKENLAYRILENRLTYKQKSHFVGYPKKSYRVYYFDKKVRRHVDATLRYMRMQEDDTRAYAQYLWDELICCGCCKSKEYVLAMEPFSNPWLIVNKG